MRSNNETVIEISKKKILPLFLGACAFVILGLWLFSFDETDIQRLPAGNRSPIFIHGFGIVTIVFFGLIGLSALRKLFGKKAGIVFSESGIVDNASGVSVGFIPWSEIKGSEIRKGMLVIKVKNPKKYFERGGPLKRALNKANYKMCGSPIAISTSALEVNLSELLATSNEYKEKYSNA